MTKYPRFSREWWAEGLFGDPWSSDEPEPEDDPPDDPANTLITVAEVLAGAVDDQCADCGEVIEGAHGGCQGRP